MPKPTRSSANPHCLQAAAERSEAGGRAPCPGKPTPGFAALSRGLSRGRFASIAPTRSLGRGFVTLLLTLALLGSLFTAHPAHAREDPPGAGMVRLDLPERVDLLLLVKYVGERKGINFLYDEQPLANAEVTIRAPREIPSAALVPLLESALAMKNFEMSPTDVPGMMKIVQGSDSLTKRTEEVLTEGEALPGDERRTVAVTRVFEIEHAGLDAVAQTLDPFLRGRGASVKPLGGTRLVLVTDHADNLPRLAELLSVIDRPGPEVAMRFRRIEHRDAADLVEKVKQLIDNRQTLRPDGTPPVFVVADEAGNQVVLVGRVAAVEEAVSMIDAFDVPRGLEVRFYRLSIADPEEVDELITQMIGEAAAERTYSSATSSTRNLMAISTTPAIHQQVAALIEMLEQPPDEAESPVRFHRLEHAKAEEVLKTLESLEGSRGLGGVAIDGVRAPDEGQPPRVQRQGPTGESVNTPELASRGDTEAGGGVRLPDARVVADAPTNTVIVVADPATQAVYEKLIKRLDVRRPQVLIEATIVTIDTSDDFELGVEIFRAEDDVDGGELLTFSQFGLTTRDAMTGAVSLVPGTGFNGALLNADTATVVLRALESDARARVVSRPNLLVNDNEEGRLNRQDEEPFASINTTNDVTTESLGGFAEAGTSIEVEPQISEGDHLNLRYLIELSSFTGAATDTLPPARQTNRLESTATIPDGHTIVVGGLTLNNEDDNVDRVPILGELPILEYAFSNRRIERSQTTLFVFLRAVILRDDQFEDLHHISMDAARRAELDEGYPESEPVLIR